MACRYRFFLAFRYLVSVFWTSFILGFIIVKNKNGTDQVPFLFYESKILFLCLFFHTDYFTTLIEAAMRAYPVWQSHLTAITALHQTRSSQRVLRTSSISATFRMFSLWKWCHLITPKYIKPESPFWT